MSNVESRREFLKKSSLLLGGAAVLGGTGLLTGCGAAEAEVPEHPFVYAEIDPAKAEEIAYKAFFDDIGGCCYGTAHGLLECLREEVGYPFTLVPDAMFASGAGGYGQQSLCGSLGGAVAVIGMVCEPKVAKKITGQLMKWYKDATLPIYHPEYDFAKYTTCHSVNCKDSVGLFMRENGIKEMSEPPRKARCAGVCADCARKTAELLNIEFGFATAPAEPETTPDVCGANEYIGTSSKDFGGGTLKVKVTVDDKKNIQNIEVLETTATLDQEVQKIIGMLKESNGAKIDAVSGATISSNALMEAVADAMSQIK